MRRLFSFPARAALALSGALERRLVRAGQIPLSWRRWARLWCREQARRMNRDFHTDLYEADPDSLWRMRPGGALGALRANSLGLMGPEPRDTPPAVGRWLFLTSSGAVFGARPYPFSLGDALHVGGFEIEILNGGMHGATSAQGVVLAERLVPALRPTVVFISYLWNDHWRASVATDVDMMALVSDEGALFRRHTGMSLTAWAVRRLRWLAVRARLTPPRVPPQAYRDNHRRLAALIRAHGAVPVFLDLPGNQERSVHPGYLRLGFAASESEFREGHARQAAWLRGLARELGVIHIDLEPEFAAHANRDLLYHRDHLHWSSRGVNHAVRALLPRLAEHGVISAEMAERCLARWRPTSLCPDDMRAEIRVGPIPDSAASGGEVVIGVEIVNTGNTIWLARTEGAVGQVRLAAQLWAEGKEPDAPPAIDARVDLPRDVLPGDSVTLRHMLRMPETAGVYRLRVDLVSELVTFFHSHAGREPLEWGIWVR